MYIAPGYRDEDWKKLNLDDDASSDWAKAIKILEARIKGRYLDPADMLISADQKESPKNRRFGFSVLAIDCLLVETFQAFIEGRKETRNLSEKMFKLFLTTRPAFSSYFNQQRAKRFYYDFRCGILHQAEVPADSVVWSVGPLVKVDGKKMTINRTKFHDALKKEFDAYLKDLANSLNIQPRRNFRKKMDNICRV